MAEKCCYVYDILLYTLFLFYMLAQKYEKYHVTHEYCVRCSASTSL